MTISASIPQQVQGSIQRTPIGLFTCPYDRVKGYNHPRIGLLGPGLPCVGFYFRNTPGMHHAIIVGLQRMHILSAPKANK